MKADLTPLRRRITTRAHNLRQATQDRFRREDRLIRKRNLSQRLADRRRKYQLHRWFGEQLVEYYQKQYEKELRSRPTLPVPSPQKEKSVRFADVNHVTQIPVNAAHHLPPPVVREMGVPIVDQEGEDSDGDYHPEQEDQSHADTNSNAIIEHINDVPRRLRSRKVQSANSTNHDIEEKANNSVPTLLDMEALAGVDSADSGDEPQFTDVPPPPPNKPVAGSDANTKNKVSLEGSAPVLTPTSVDFDPATNVEIERITDSDSMDSVPPTIGAVPTPPLTNSAKSYKHHLKPKKSTKKRRRASKGNSPGVISVASQKLDTDLDDIFSGLQGRNRASNGSKETRNQKLEGTDVHKTMGRSRREYTEEGWKVYSIEDLKKEQPSNLTGPCPFDCSCCFV